jgi:D-inositol-3-phosphate glycosyltransferase
LYNKLKIAILSIHSSPLGVQGTQDTGGMSTYLLGLTKALGASGHLVDIYTRALTGSYIKATDLFTNVRLIYLNDGLGPLNKYELAQHTNQFSEMIDEVRKQHNLHYNLLFSHYWISGLVGQQLRAKWQLPHLLMFHTLGRAKNDLCPGEDEPMARLTAEEKLALSADLVIVAARSERERLLNYYPLNPDRVQVIPIGLDRQLFRPLDGSDAKEKIGIRADKIILSVGRLEPVKGFDLLLAAAAFLDPGVDFKVVIVGGDDRGRDLKADLKKRAKRLHLNDRVIFTGHAAYEYLPYYYNAAAVTVIPSYYESFGLVALESLACNTPLITGPVGVIPELVEDPVSTGLVHLVPERSPALWAAKIKEVLSAPHPFAKDGAGHIPGGFSWAAAAKRFADLSRDSMKNAL